MAHPYATDLRARFGFDLDLGLEEGVELPYEGWLRQLLVRRTHRRYLDQPVSDAIVRLLLAAAFSASSKSDFQQASAIWLKDRERRDRLAAFLVFLGDARRLERLGELRGHPQANGTFEDFFNAAIDGALALQTCVLAAETIGLGTCPISVLRNRIAEVAEILELPDRVFPVAGLCLGYPAQPGHISMRLPLDATVHIDRYEDSGLDQAVQGYDKRRDARFSIRDRQRDPERFGTAEFYGWSEDKARQATAPEGVGFAEWLKKHGFRFDKP
jgi:FMN reductase [NAD(P)H]